MFTLQQQQQATQPQQQQQQATQQQVTTTVPSTQNQTTEMAVSPIWMMYSQNIDKGRLLWRIYKKIGQF